jgi:hypothetical protein
MGTTLSSSGITFGDGSTQTTKTPTVISNFTNDRGFLTSLTVAATYATPAQTATNFGFDTGYGVVLQLQNINGTVIYGGFYNCNCNC